MHSDKWQSAVQAIVSPGFTSLTSVGCDGTSSELSVVMFSVVQHTFLLTMGRKCFEPHCNTGYKSCRQKFSFFSTPKNEARLKLWRHAIPCKDRSLQELDNVCEKHLELHFVLKTWTA